LTLHILSSQNRFYEAFCSKEDAILLIEDGVYQDLQTTLSTYVLGADRKARGLSLQPDRTEIDYDGMVELCAQHNKVVSW
jgi:sulfur relay protein TusB/DsrH